jgi:SAM-dependent methyltransferase
MPTAPGRAPRVDYDEIAHLYDTQPYRARVADPELLAFAEARRSVDFAVLDIGCGTGNQLIANRGALPNLRYFGLDRSLGMLRRARAKSLDIPWLQADGGALPFADGSFDYVFSQFAFHHVQDKAGMLREILRVTRPVGRFSMRNLCPQESSDWLYYEYFPESKPVDFEDFWSPAAIVTVMAEAGFINVDAAYEHMRFEQDLAAWLETVRRRDTCSQLQAISDAAYRTGVARLEREVADLHAPRSRQNHLCIVTIRGEAPELVGVSAPNLSLRDR